MEKNLDIITVTKEVSKTVYIDADVEFDLSNYVDEIIDYIKRNHEEFRLADLSFDTTKIKDHNIASRIDTSMFKEDEIIDIINELSEKCKK